MNGVSYLDDIAEIVSLEKRGLSPIPPEKIVAVGHVMGLNERSRVIDFGCGMGEDLCLWGSRFGISGLGVEWNEGFCARGRERLARLGLDQKIEMVCRNAAEYAFEAGAFDAATCLGASFIFGGYQGAVRRLSQAIRPGRKIAIGEPYYVDKVVPPELVAYEGDRRRLGALRGH